MSEACEYNGKNIKFREDDTLALREDDIKHIICHHNEKIINNRMIRSDQISRSVVSDSLQPHESQHARPPCPSPTSGVHPDSHPSSQ